MKLEFEGQAPSPDKARNYENTVSIFLSEQNITLSDTHLDPNTVEFKTLVETIKTNITLTAKMPDALLQ